MTQRLATTPFGGGRFTAADFQNEHWIERRREALRATGNAGANDTAKADKYQLLRALTEAKVQFGVGDRAIRVLEALLSFHQSKEIAGEEPVVVFPSNKELALRTRGMAHVTIRRHIRALVEARLIVRRDSPNGKRYCVKDGHGDVEQAYGFDLSPFRPHGVTHLPGGRDGPRPPSDGAARAGRDHRPSAGYLVLDRDGYGRGTFWGLVWDGRSPARAVRPCGTFHAFG